MEEQEQKKTPIEHLATFPNAPSAARIEEWKSQVPGGRVALLVLPPDAKRVFVLRGLSGFEMLKLQKEIPENVQGQNVQLALENKAAAAAVLWTSITADGKVDDLTLQKGPAGLSQTLFMKVSELSCFMTPDQVDAFSGEL